MSAPVPFCSSVFAAAPPPNIQLVDMFRSIVKEVTQMQTLEQRKTARTEREACAELEAAQAQMAQQFLAEGVADATPNRVAELTTSFKEAKLRRENAQKIYDEVKGVEEEQKKLINNSVLLKVLKRVCGDDEGEIPREDVALVVQKALFPSVWASSLVNVFEGNRNLLYHCLKIPHLWNIPDELKVSVGVCFNFV
jgi:hypothetical protein